MTKHRATTLAPAPIPTMTCLEVWGGNHATETSFGTLGLEIWIYSQPHEAADAGGDIHYVSSCATGRITRILVADVSGHGQSVSEVATRLRGLMRQHVSKIDQRRFVETMNRDFTNLKSNGAFATAIAATYLSPFATFTLTNAGHPSPLLFRRASGAWEVLLTKEKEPAKVARRAEGGLADLPLGVLDDINYGERTFRVADGDLLLIYTDSLIESLDAQGQQLGVDGLRRELAKLGEVPAEGLIGRLLEAIRQLHPENLLQDDTTVVLLQSRGKNNRVPLSRMLLAPFRVLGDLVWSRLSGQPVLPPDVSYRPPSDVE